MPKLTPTFSWQSYEGKNMSQADQFQFQLQSMHVQTANSTNSTIDDLSYVNFPYPRQTSWAWIDNNIIYRLTLPTSSWTAGGTVNTIPIGLVGDFYIIYMDGFLSDGQVAASNTLDLPHLDVAVAANSISYVRNGTNIVITTGGTDYSAFSGYVTIYFINTNTVS